jgi:NTE family protein
MDGPLSVGLVLGAGAARGWAHIGVLRILAKAGIVPDIVVGTSMGAVVGGCYAAGELDELDAFARSLTRRRVLGFLDLNFSGSGLINGRRLCDQLDVKLRTTDIETLAKRFVAVATEIGTGHEVWLSRGRLVDAMRASYALPGIFKPVQLDGRWLFDGALVNPVPVSVARALGARYVIAVNVNADLSGRGSLAPVSHGARPAAQVETTAVALLPDVPTSTDDSGNVLVRNGRVLKKMLQRQVFGAPDNGPGISTVMMEAFNIVQDRIARSRLAGDPPDIVIAPRTSSFGLFDFHRAEDLIAAGEQAAHRMLDDVVREIAVRRNRSPGRSIVA